MSSDGRFACLIVASRRKSLSLFSKHIHHCPCYDLTTETSFVSDTSRLLSYWKQCRCLWDPVSVCLCGYDQENSEIHQRILTLFFPLTNNLSGFQLVLRIPDSGYGLIRVFRSITWQKSKLSFFGDISASYCQINAKYGGRRQTLTQKYDLSDKFKKIKLCKFKISDSRHVDYRFFCIFQRRGQVT